MAHARMCVMNFSIDSIELHPPHLIGVATLPSESQKPKM